MVLVLELFGAFVLVLAYVGQDRWWRDTDLSFLVLNIVGAAALVAAAALLELPGFVVFSCFWLGAAVRALVSRPRP